jgi:hypothetical protein
LAVDPSAEDEDEVEGVEEEVEGAGVGVVEVEDDSVEEPADAADDVDPEPLRLSVR